MRTGRALATAALMTLVGCAGGAVGTTVQPRPQAGPPATVTQTRVSNSLDAVAGIYTLVAIDGHALPYTREAARVGTLAPTEVLSGTLVVNPNGTFTVSTQYRAMEPSGERRFAGLFSGACASVGDAYRLYWDGGGETVLTASGDTVTVDNEGARFQYKRAH